MSTALCVKIKAIWRYFRCFGCRTITHCLYEPNMGKRMAILNHYACTSLGLIVVRQYCQLISINSSPKWKVAISYICIVIVDELIFPTILAELQCFGHLVNQHFSIIFPCFKEHFSTYDGILFSALVHSNRC